MTNPFTKSWVTAYDLAGRRSAITDPLSHVLTFTYDAGDNLSVVTNALGFTTTYAFDSVGNRTTITDANLNVTAFAYDEKNRLTTVTDAAAGVTRYGYDANDNRTVLTNALGFTSTWGYDKNNRVLTETLPLSLRTVFQYDGPGNRTRRTDANGAVTTYAYDLINRPVTMTSPAGVITSTYNAANLRTVMTDTTGATLYAGACPEPRRRDELNRLSSTTLPGSRVVSYLYDAAGNRTRITYPDSKTVDYGYDDANRMSSVTDWLSKVTGYSYDDAGRVITTTYPTGVTETRGYNAADQLTAITSTQGAATVISFTYALDNAGLRTAVLDPAGTESYAYDSLYRLTAVTYTDAFTQTYSYDAGGNRQTKADPTSTTSYTYDNADRMTAAGGVNYTYDSNGNQTGRGSDTFGWDALNRMVTATVASTNITYTYRGDDLRHTKLVGSSTTTYTWDLNAGLPVVLQDGTSTYVYGLGLVSQTDASGNQTYLLANGLGSTEKLTDGSGTVVGTYKYDAFGAVRSSSGTASTEYRFTGQQDDATLGYQYLRARYYDPALGRFVSRDAFKGLAVNPLSQHPYAYVSNNPVMLTDPSGMCPPIEDCIEQILNATASPAYAPGLDDLERLIAASEQCGTGGALPTMDRLSLVGALLPGPWGKAEALANARRLGIEGEAIAGIVRNTTRLDSALGTAKYRVPDAVNAAARLMTEVKNVASLAYTKQLRDYSAIARSLGYRFELIVRQNTSLSGPLLDAIAEGRIVLRRLLP